MMPAPVTAAPVATSTGQAAEYLMFGMVRELRAEAQNLQKTLAEVKKKSKLANKQVREQEIAAALQESEKIFAYNRAQIDERLEALRSLLRGSPPLYDTAGDTVTNMENSWERTGLEWPTLPSKREDLDVEEIIGRIDSVHHLLNELIFEAGKMTIPNRVNQHLEQLRVGQPLDFHANFKDEMPVASERKKILQYMGDHPTAIHGLVDADSGMIYRVAQRLRRRFASFALMTFVLIFGGFMIFLASWMGQWLKLQQWPITPERSAEFLGGYIFIVIGAAAHIGVGAVKQARSAKKGSFVPLENWLLWVHVKELPIAGGFLSLWVGFWGLAFSVSSIQWQTAFLVGYSLDSFVDLFLQKFGSAVSTQTEALTEQLS